MMWEIKQNVDLADGKIAQINELRIAPMAYPGNANGHAWKVSVFEHNAPASLAGATGVAYFKRYDGNTVVIPCTISGNEVSVGFATEVYAVPGPVSAVMNLTIADTLVVSVAAINFQIKPVMDGNPIDPSGEIALDVDTLIADIASAVASIPVSYTDLMTSIAPIFTSSDPYYAGQYVWYNGVLKRYLVDHDAGAWNAAEVINAALGTETTELKAAITEKYTNLLSPERNTLTVNGVKYIYSNGHFKVLGTATNSGGRTQRITQVTLPAGSYVIRSYNFDAHSHDYPELFLHNNSNTIIATVPVATGADATVTLSEETIVYLGINIVSGRIYDADFDIQLQTGTASTSYVSPLGTAIDFSARDRLTTAETVIDGMKNFVTPEMYGAVGDGTTDDTAAIRAAVDTGLPVLFSTKTYRVSVSANNGVAIPVTKDGTTINLNGATIKLAANAFGGYGIFGVDQKSNVTIANGQIVGDKATHTGSSGEWGHGISLSKVANVTLENLHISGCWGDGIYIGNDSTSTTHNDGISIHNVVCDGNRRNGMSVIDGKNIFVSDSAFNNTSGTDPQDGVDIEPNDANSVFSVFFDNVVCAGNAHWGFDVNNDHGASNSEFNVVNLTTDGMRLRSAGQNTKIQVSNVTNNWSNAANAMNISNHYMSSIIRVTGMYIDCSGKSPASIAVLFDGNYQHNIKFDDLTVANGTVSRVTSWGQTSREEGSHVNIAGLKLFNLTTTDDVSLVPFYHVINSQCSVTTGNVPSPVEVTLPYTAQAYSNYKVTTATADQTITLTNIVPGKKVCIQNASSVRIRVRPLGIALDNPTTSDYFELGSGKTVAISYEDSAATGKCHAILTYSSEYVTPEMFGAVGDGVTKDGAAVQAALNSGKTVVGSGIYNIDTDAPYSNLYYIGIPNGAHMVGGTYKFPDDGYSDTDASVGMSAFVGNSFTIEGVTFDMNGYENIPVATKVMYAVFVDDCTNVTIRDCRFVDSAGRNYIFVKRGYGFRLEDCTFHNGGTNLDGSDVTKQNDFSYIYTSAENSVITGCVIEAPDDDVFTYCGGFEIHGNNNRVQNNEIHDCLPAIYVAQHWANNAETHDVIVSNNALLNCQGGVALYDNITLDNIEVSGNYITLAPITPVNRAMYGIGSGVHNTLSNFTLTGNTIIQNEASTYGCSGISWGNATGVKATHNILKDIPTPFWIGGNTANNDIVIEHNLIKASSLNASYAITREYTSAEINRLTICENEIQNYAGLLDSISTVDDYLVLDRIVDMSCLIEKSKNLVPVGTNSTAVYEVAATYKNGVVELNGTTTRDGGRNTNLSPKWTLPAGTYSWRARADSALPARMMVFVQSGTSIISQSESNYATPATFTLAEATEVYVSINVASGNSYVGKMYWELEAGSTCGPFIPSGAYTAVDLIARNG